MVMEKSVVYFTFWNWTTKKKDTKLMTIFYNCFRNFFFFFLNLILYLATGANKKTCRRHLLPFQECGSKRFGTVNLSDIWYRCEKRETKKKMGPSISGSVKTVPSKGLIQMRCRFVVTLKNAIDLIRTNNWNDLIAITSFCFHPQYGDDTAAAAAATTPPATTKKNRYIFRLAHP